jgi:hypothetical protein
LSVKWKNSLPRSLGNVTLQERHEIVTIEVGLERLIADLQAVQKLSHDVGIAASGQRLARKFCIRYNLRASMIVGAFQPRALGFA